MEAFNVPYCGIDLNQAIGNLSFQKTGILTINQSNPSEQYTLTHDICTFSFYMLIYNAYLWNISITARLNESFTYTISLEKVQYGTLTKSGPSVSFTWLTSSKTIDCIIYEFDFA
jgi:hypothetical protein